MFIKFKNFFNNTFKLINIRIKLIRLQIYYYAFYKNAKVKKMTFKLKTLGFCIV